MVVVREAHPSETAVLVGIGVRAWTGHVFAFEPETPGMQARVQRAFEDFVADHLDAVSVAEADGAIRGWGACDCGRITDLWVDPEWQGRGTGSRLLTALIDRMGRAGHRRAWLDTHARNRDAIRFYERHGFRIVERRREMSTSLGRRIDMVCLERPISLETDDLP